MDCHGFVGRLALASVRGSQSGRRVLGGPVEAGRSVIRSIAVGIPMMAVAAFPQAASARGTSRTGHWLTVCPSGCQFTTITDALGAASNGGRIAVGAGSYDGGFAIDKRVTLRGEGAAVTTIHGGGPVLTVSAGAVVQVRGFTISGGGPGVGGGAGIYNNGTLTMRNSVVTANRGYDDGGGIFNDVSGTLRVSDSTISDNYVEENGSGIDVFGGTVTLRHVTISGNTASAAGTDDGIGAGVFIWPGARFTMRHTAVTENTSNGGSGGIENQGTAELIDSSVTANTALFGAGGIRTVPTITLIRTTVAGNTPIDCLGC